jgi:hypothetical protein
MPKSCLSYSVVEIRIRPKKLSVIPRKSTHSLSLMNGRQDGIMYVYVSLHHGDCDNDMARLQCKKHSDYARAQGRDSRY